MYVKTKFFLFIALLLLAGCSNDDRKETLTPTGDQPLELTKLSTNNKFNQQPANEAKDLLSQYEEVAGIYGVNNDSQLIIAIDVDHLDRFDLTDIENALKQKVKENFNEMSITLSTDHKLRIELEQLEHAIQANKITKKALTKKINDLKKLSKEET